MSKQSTHNQMLESKLKDGHKRDSITIWNSPERDAFINSIEKKFNVSKANIFFRGVVALVEKERDIQANISLGCHVEAYYTPVTKALHASPPPRAQYDTIYIYDIFVDSLGKYNVLYKDNEEYTDYNFKGLRFNVKNIDEDIISQFSLIIEKGIPK